jgi:heme-degrading monooxygenase HmoA
MDVRVVTFTGANDIDAGITFTREKVLPMLSAQKGYRGLNASADRPGGVFAVLSLWETAADRDATEAGLSQTRQEAADIIGGELRVETFEQLVAEIGQQPPGPGSALMVTRISMDPAKIDENTAFFKTEIVPRIKASEGFRGLRNLMNRSTGEGIVGTAWADDAARDREAREAQTRRADVAAARGINFGEVSFREIVLVDMR